MLKLKFSKKSIVSVLFLLAALFIALFLGSYKFLTMENLDNMDTSAPAPAPASSHSPKNAPAPAPAPAASPVSITDADITKLLSGAK